MHNNIYNLKLHETTIIEAIVVKNGAYPTKWQVTRVPGGWFYQDANPNRTTVSEFFVPFNNEFMTFEDSAKTNSQQ